MMLQSKRVSAPIDPQTKLAEIMHRDLAMIFSKLFELVLKSTNDPGLNFNSEEAQCNSDCRGASNTCTVGRG